MNKTHINYNEYVDICIENEIKEDEDQSKLLDLLKDMGVVCNFSKYPIDAKKVLNHKWITNAVYKIMTEPDLKKANGYLLKNNIGKIINKKFNKVDLCKDYNNEYCDFVNYSYSDDDRNYILNLMEEFELSYSLNPTYELIPALMNKSEPEFKFDKDNSLQYKFAPSKPSPLYININGCFNILSLKSLY